MVVDAFGGALGGQQGILGTNVRLRVQAHVPLLQTYSGRYTATPGADGRSVDVVFSNIFNSEQRDVLLKLRVPSCGDAVDRFPLLSATVEYQTVDGETRYGRATCDTLASDSSATGAAAGAVAGGGVGGTATAASGVGAAGGGAAAESVESTPAVGKEGGPVPVSESTSPDADAVAAGAAGAASDTRTAVCCVRRLASPLSAETNLSVDVQKNRAVVGEVLAQALRLADQHDLSGARRVLQDTIDAVKKSPSFLAGNPACASLIEDLEDGLRRVRDDDSYFRTGGRAEMCEMTTTISAQRCVYSKAGKSYNPYQSEGSMLTQQVAYNSKSAAKKGFW